MSSDDNNMGFWRFIFTLIVLLVMSYGIAGRFNEIDDKLDQIKAAQPPGAQSHE
jgi:hypothetical protein